MSDEHDRFEPEVAYMDLEGDMDLAEDFLVEIVGRVLEKHGDEIREVLERDTTALQRVQKPFPRIHYDRAVEEVRGIQAETADPELKALLEIEWGMDFGAPHETELTKRYDRPIVVHHFPSAIKAFYMKKDPASPRHALAMDVLAPEGYGEVIGGGQREDDLAKVEAGIDAHDLPREAFEWYLDLRRYGSVPHAGFGLALQHRPDRDREALRDLAELLALRPVRDDAVAEPDERRKARDAERLGRNVDDVAGNANAGIVETSGLDVRLGLQAHERDPSVVMALSSDFSEVSTKLEALSKAR